MAELVKSTWEQFEKRALHDPVLASFVAHVRQGNLTREEAAIAAALVLSETAEAYRQDAIERRSLERPPIWRNLEIKESIEWLQKLIDFQGTIPEARARAEQIKFLLEQLQREVSNV